MRSSTGAREVLAIELFAALRGAAHGDNDESMRSASDLLLEELVRLWALYIGELRMGYCFFWSWLVGSDVGHVELWHDCTDVNARLEQKKTLELEGMRQ